MHSFWVLFGAGQGACAVAEIPSRKRTFLRHIDQLLCEHGPWYPLVLQAPGTCPHCTVYWHACASFLRLTCGVLGQKMLVVTLCLMSLAALPTLIFAGVGSRISSSKMDSAGFAALTLGNIGGCTNLNTSSAITLTSVNCTSDTEPIALFGGELARTTASYIITACDAGYTALFMGAVFVLWLTINGMESDFEHKRVSIQRCVGDAHSRVCA